MADFEWAQSVLDADERPSLSDIARALQILADSSADPELRLRMQDVSFQQLLSLLSGLAASSAQESSNLTLWRNLLRCVGNMIADNDARRAQLLEDPTYLMTLDSFLTSISNNPESTTLVDITVKVLFNLCTDYTPAQKECFNQNIHQSLIYCLDTRLAVDQGIWGLALDLTCMILEHKQELKPSQEYPDFEANAPRLLRLPLAEVDATAFLDALTLVAAHLLDKNFVQKLVEHKQIEHIWKLLKRTEHRMLSDRETEDQDDYDEKQYLQFQLVLSQGLADMTALPLYNDKYDTTDSFIQSLYPQVIPTSTDPTSRSPVAPAACLILGNLIISDEAAISLAPHIPIKDLFAKLGRSNDSAFLNAASGLLRHLSTPVQNREHYFADPEYLLSTRHLYTDIPLEQVQMGGLALTRQILANMKPRLVALLSSATNKFLSTLLSIYQTTTSTSVKLEMSRLVVSFFRTLQASSATVSEIETGEEEATRALFDTPVNTSSILDPLVFSIKHAAEPGIIAIQAEAWLGLNLAARLPSGARKVSTAFSDDEELFALFISRLGGKPGDGEEVKDERPEWLREKERDNAVLLGAELIKAEDVDGDVKEKFKLALREKEIRIG
ncbi:hypothetical protein AUEXF2481DRAFT_6668 [Aureobasidium subglaciale EXF-2481]|uniref:Uncharacterized protein n=1 Tax=Aureobasidium subglaciale (strain EXF-2481) TaxID=1043005 RepID=A0A074YC61_AURSE|nr:uncharacterized protein AUEXF2481DRAFT_6668 [Aureobasidium subglaciale EXF-2481]KEQ93599.1 hypothetical protein AUEXF2481DRAFT_6668 [Aureobasidium subglaciale EXF-2481]